MQRVPLANTCSHINFNYIAIFIKKSLINLTIFIFYAIFSLICSILQTIELRSIWLFCTACFASWCKIIMIKSLDLRSRWFNLACFASQTAPSELKRWSYAPSDYIPQQRSCWWNIIIRPLGQLRCPVTYGTAGTL